MLRVHRLSYDDTWYVVNGGVSGGVREPPGHTGLDGKAVLDVVV